MITVSALHYIVPRSLCLLSARAIYIPGYWYSLLNQKVLQLKVNITVTFLWMYTAKTKDNNNQRIIYKHFGFILHSLPKS